MSDADRSEGASWWALACRFLDRFAAGGAGHPNLAADDRFDAWMLRAHRVSGLLDTREAHEPWPWPGLADALEALVAGDAEPGDTAHAVAWAIDERFARTFPDDWIAGAPADGFDLADGDLYPVLETPWSIFQPFLSRPASMSDPRPDELPHARRFRAGELRTEKVAHVRIHPVTALLRDVLSTLTSVATAHPNLALDEIQWPTGARIWPVTVRDEARQLATVTDLVGAALDGGSRLIVLPELSATAATIAAVRALLDARYDEDEDPALVLVGSRHLEVDGHRRNRAVTLIAASATQLHHDKLVPFRRGTAIEGLDGPGTLHLYQDGPFRLAGAICKDLLDGDVETLLERLGVNVLLVPAMSTKTSNFPLAAGRLLHTAQTLTVVANGPLTDDRGAPIAHCSMMARPTTGLSLVSWPPGGPHAAPPVSPVWVSHPLDAGPPSAHVLS